MRLIVNIIIILDWRKERASRVNMQYVRIFQLIICWVFILQLSNCFSQSHFENDSLHLDSHYMVIDNPAKSKLWGNSWHFPLGYSIGISQEFEFGIGRSYKRNFCGGGGCIFQTNSWGVGYGISTQARIIAQNARIYYGYNFFYYPPFSAGFRGDYIFDLTNNVHYIKPSFGFSFIVGEIFYSYGLKLNSGNRFLPAHAITLRINLMYPLKKWEEHYPNQC